MDTANSAAASTVVTAVDPEEASTESASSTASIPNSVVNLMTGLRATEDVSL